MDSRVQNFFGGSPGAVLVKLLFLSLIVGAFMAFLNITAFALIDRVVRAFRSIFDLSFDALRDVGRWIVYGAIIVVPVWLASRVLRGRR